MKKKVPVPIKDGAVGLAFGTAVIIPGLSGGTIALVFGAYKKIVCAVNDLFTKRFWKNLLILLPFVLGAVIAVAALIKPFELAFEYCLFSIVCLFGGFILGAIPGVHDKVKDEKATKKNWIQLIIGFIIAGIIGVFSVIFSSYPAITKLFIEKEWYLYFIIAIAGFLSSTGLIVPGFSGSMLLMIIGFYNPVLTLTLDIVRGVDFWKDLSLFLAFTVGVGIGFVFFSKLMHRLFTFHERSTLFVVLGFLFGSLLSIFFNSQMFEYYTSGMSLYDIIIGPFAFVLGTVLSYLLVVHTRKLQKQENAEN